MTSPVTLNDAIKAAIDYKLNNVHTALPASIISYDYTTQKASVQPLLNKSWTSGSNVNPANNNVANELSTPMPVLDNVPVIFPRGGGGGLTFPVVSGDTCLLVFIERSTDLWLTVGGQVTPDDNRKFDLSDAVAIMGLFPFTQTSTADNNTDMVLTYAGSLLRIKANGDVVIQTSNKVAIGNTTTEVLQVLSSFLGDMITALYGVGTLDPATTAALTILQAKIDTLRGMIP